MATRCTRREALCGGLGALAAGLAGCSSGSGDETPGQTTTSSGTETDHDWPTFRHDVRNTGFNRGTAGPSEKPTIDWHVDGFREAHVTLADGTLYTGGKNTVRALEAETGETKWTYTVGDTVDAAPAVAEGTVVFPAWDGAVYALSTADGSEQWVRTGSSVSDSALDAAGSTLQTGAVTIVDGTVYNAGVTWGKDSFFALDLESGDTEFVIDGTPDNDDNAWDVGDDDTASFVSAPAIADGMAYLAETSGVHYAIDVGAGSIAWASDPSDTRGGRGSSTVVDGTVYFASQGNNDNEQALYALDAASGDTQWRYHIGPQEGLHGVRASTAFAHGAALVAHTGGQLHAVEPTGEERWTVNTDGAIYAAASAGSEHVYVADYSGSLYAIDPASGDVVWQFSEMQGVGDIDSPPLVADGTIYVSGQNLFALRPA